MSLLGSAPIRTLSLSLSLSLCVCTVSASRCPVIFDGLNYRNWFQHMRLHMHGQCLWDFLACELPYLPRSVLSVELVLPKDASEDTCKEASYVFEDAIETFQTQYATYKTWIDEDASVSAILVASMEVHLTRDVVRICATATSRLALTAVRSEKIRFRGAGLLPSQSFPSVLAAPSASTPTTSPATPPVVPSPMTVAVGRGLRCTYCNKDEHVEQFCYRKKDLRRGGRPPKGTSGFSSERSSGASDTQELLTLLHRMAAFAPFGFAGSAVQSSSERPPSTSSSSSISHWILVSGASFHMTSDSTSLTSISPLAAPITVQIADAHRSQGLWLIPLGRIPVERLCGKTPDYSSLRLFGCAWSISQLDVKNVFLNATTGYSVPKGMVCRLRRSLYGLKQAPRVWFDRFSSVITMAGFSAGAHDPALFIHISSRGWTLLVLYVDDMIITGDDS
uniref:Putative retrotransposon protein n=1 Tax=Phyllostachys edulis TaxID=38705 RepID=D3IVM5_PHYED|nr:putative retrotransposon protein [Phyllostachys edulis]